MKSINEIIKNRRLMLNITMDFVATKVNISRATLYSIEKGKYNCSLKTFLKLLKFLNIDLILDTKNLNNHKRKRATRINTVKEKKINRFIIMCVEQYAKYINEKSNVVYKKLENKKIIDNLNDNYEDLHGMSTEYLNNYISLLMR